VRGDIVKRRAQHGLALQQHRLGDAGEYRRRQFVQGIFVLMKALDDTQITHCGHDVAFAKLMLIKSAAGCRGF